MFYLSLLTMKNIFAIAEMSLLVGPGPYFVPVFCVCVYEHSTPVFLYTAEVPRSILECGKR